MDIKRTICKGCRAILLAGVTCKIRIKKKKAIWICIQCKTIKNFDLRNPDYKLWTQTDDSIVEVLDYGKNH